MDIPSENVLLGAGTDIRSSAHLNNVSVGDRTKIRDYTIIFGSREHPAKIGHTSWVGAFCYFNGFWGLEIGDRVDIANSVNIYTDSGPEVSEKLLKKYPTKKGAVIIGSDVWINAGVLILPGVRIGSGVVIMPNTVVNRDVPDGVVYGGTPGRVIKKIF
ncbi:MAG: acyltransferase [Patescibacteria group bacterium]